MRSNISLAFRPVEEDPHRELAGNILETMILVRCSEEDITRSEAFAFTAIEERPFTAHHHMDFVTIMWGLRATDARSMG